MTTKQQRLLSGALQELASRYNAPQVLNLKNAVQESFEDNESDSAETLGVKLGDVVLNSHLIGMTDDKKVAFYTYWTTAAGEIKSA